VFHPVDTRFPAAVENEVDAICAAMFPAGDRGFVRRAFGWVTECFAGRFADYRPIDTGYHDFEHTMQGTLCLAQLLQGRHAARAAPVLTLDWFRLGLFAILFHDSGYLKHGDDREGTGAKYTPTHVDRSTVFAREFLSGHGIVDADIRAVQNMIRCTGINMDLAAIPFASEVERTVGFALGTADLIGQMAAPDYVEKLPVLYQEFAEAARFDATHLPPEFAFGSADALMRHTPAFWNEYVKPKIDVGFGGLHAFLRDPSPDGPNFYLQRIEDNIARLRRTLAMPPG